MHRLLHVTWKERKVSFLFTLPPLYQRTHLQVSAVRFSRVRHLFQKPAPRSLLSPARLFDRMGKSLFPAARHSERTEESLFSSLVPLTLKRSDPSSTALAGRRSRFGRDDPIRVLHRSSSAACSSIAPPERITLPALFGILPPIGLPSLRSSRAQEQQETSSRMAHTTSCTLFSRFPSHTQRSTTSRSAP